MFRVAPTHPVLVVLTLEKELSLSRGVTVPMASGPKTRAAKYTFVPFMLSAMKLDQEIPFGFVIVNVRVVIAGLLLLPFRVSTFVNLPMEEMFKLDFEANLKALPPGRVTVDPAGALNAIAAAFPLFRKLKPEFNEIVTWRGLVLVG